ncbi:Src-like-adapter 2 [Labeo rohita]|uniref:Src-like-adapter 2 n=1 Tax=Labeo rohita TaxID=84645 RepID=A0ABQ8M8I4_LABRO|nr:Src-like-adapter 2 [Labeo rohita]
MHMAVALCNFPPHRSDEHTIFLGDKLNILSEDDDMLTVRSTSTGAEFFIPHTYVSKVHNRWLFEGITRRNAEQLLMLPPNYSGCFLIRESQSSPGSRAWASHTWRRAAKSVAVKFNQLTCHIAKRAICRNCEMEGSTFAGSRVLVAARSDRLICLFLCDHIVHWDIAHSPVGPRQETPPRLQQANRGHMPNVKHYRIHQLHNGWFYIHHSHYFSTLAQLNFLSDGLHATTVTVSTSVLNLKYNSAHFLSVESLTLHPNEARSSNGTYCQLTEPCLLQDSNRAIEHRPSSVTIQRSNLNWRDLSRSMIQRQLKGTDQECLVSEGLRETMKAYFYVTEESNYED